MDPVKDRTIHWGLRALSLGGLLAGLIVVNSSPALASCHQFRVTAAPSSVAEGGTVVVTVTRDNSVAPSSIHLSTVDETAKAGKDYIAINQNVSFTGTQLKKQYTLSTIDDHLVESAETFRLHLSNPAGCLGTGYDVGPDVRVTIKDNDLTTTPTKTPTASAQPTVVPSSPTPTSSVTPSPRASKSLTPSAPYATTPSSPSSSESAFAAGSTDSGSGSSVLPWVGAALLILAGFGAFILRRRRTNP